MPSLIDIFIPTYEPKAEHLRQALDSVMAQTEKNWNLFVHDDASTVDVRAIVEPFLHDARITFVKSSQRLGIGGNWNACLKQGAAPYAQYLFQDDTWEPAYLKRSLSVLEKHPDVGFTAADHRYEIEGSQDHSAYDELRALRKELLKSGTHSGKEFLAMWVARELHPNLIGEPSFVMLRRSLIERVGEFDASMPQFLDAEYWIRCLLHTDWHFIDAELGAFRVHTSAASAQNQQSGAGIYDRLTSFERLINTLPHGTLRTETISARNRALDTMAKKFFARMRGGKRIPGPGGGMKAFAVRHPWLVGRSLLKGLFAK